MFSQSATFWRLSQNHLFVKLNILHKIFKIVFIKKYIYIYIKSYAKYHLYTINQKIIKSLKNHFSTQDSCVENPK